MFSDSKMPEQFRFRNFRQKNARIVKYHRLIDHSCSSSHSRSSIHSLLECLPKSREALLTKKHALSRKESDCDKLLLSRTEKTEKKTHMTHILFVLFLIPVKGVFCTANWGIIPFTGIKHNH